MDAAVSPPLSLSCSAKITKPSSFVAASYIWQTDLRMSSLTASRASFLRASSIVMSSGNRRGRRPQRNTPSRESFPEETGGRDVQSSNQKELISLFKKIQASISEEQSTSTKARMRKPPKDDSSVESVLQVFQQSASGRKNKGTSSRVEEDKRFSQGKIPKKEDHGTNFKLTRSPSSFVKRSPIPSSTPVRSLNPEPTAAEGARSGLFEEALQIDQLKLHELKELAKTRGVKGYSKLKKKELIKLLSSPSDI